MASIFDLQNEQADRTAKAHKVVSVDSAGAVINGSTEEMQGDILSELSQKANLNEVQPVQTQSLGTIKTSTVELTDKDTAYQLPATEQTDRRSIIIYNSSDTDMYYGDSSVTTSNGILLVSGAEVSLDINGGLYIVCGTDSKIIRIIEMK